MSEDKNIDESQDSIENNMKAGAEPNRRRMLMMGAVAATTAVSVRPAMAQTSSSVLTCTVPIPGPHGAGQNVAPDGSLVPRNTPGSFNPYGRRFRGEDLRHAVRGRTLPGTTYQETRAYVKYIKRLRSGQSGFTCFASIQTRRY